MSLLIKIWLLFYCYVLSTFAEIEYVEDGSCDEYSTDCVINCVNCDNQEIHCPETDDCNSCIINCVGESSCDNAEIFTYTCQDVIINCDELIGNGNPAFEDAIIYAPGNFGDITLNVLSGECFKYTTLETSSSQITGNMVVNCDNTDSDDECKDMDIDATYATSLEFHCTGGAECEKSSIWCPDNAYIENGDWDNTPCLIDCSDTNGVSDACKYLDIYTAEGLNTDVTMICDDLNSNACRYADIYCGNSFGSRCDWWYPTDSSDDDRYIWDCWGSCDKTGYPTKSPTIPNPTQSPTNQPTERPSLRPTDTPTLKPSNQPSTRPTLSPSDQPTTRPTLSPSKRPTLSPSARPSDIPTYKPTGTDPTRFPTVRPTSLPTTANPSNSPSQTPTLRPSVRPTTSPTAEPTIQPTEDDNSNNNNKDDDDNTDLITTSVPTRSIPADDITDKPTMSPSYVNDEPEVTETTQDDGNHSPTEQNEQNDNNEDNTNTNESDGTNDQTSGASGGNDNDSGNDNDPGNGNDGSESDSNGSDSGNDDNNDTDGNSDNDNGNSQNDNNGSTDGNDANDDNFGNDTEQQTSSELSNEETDAQEEDSQNSSGTENIVENSLNGAGNGNDVDQDQDQVEEPETTDTTIIRNKGNKQENTESSSNTWESISEYLTDPNHIYVLILVFLMLLCCCICSCCWMYFQSIEQDYKSSFKELESHLSKHGKLRNPNHSNKKQDDASPASNNRLNQIQYCHIESSKSHSGRSSKNSNSSSSSIPSYLLNGHYCAKCGANQNDKHNKNNKNKQEHYKQPGSIYSLSSFNANEISDDHCYNCGIKFASSISEMDINSNKNKENREGIRDSLSKSNATSPAAPMALDMMNSNVPPPPPIPIASELPPLPDAFEHSNQMQTGHINNYSNYNNNNTNWPLNTSSNQMIPPPPQLVPPKQDIEIVSDDDTLFPMTDAKIAKLESKYLGNGNGNNNRHRNINNHNNDNHHHKKKKKTKKDKNKGYGNTLHLPGKRKIRKSSKVPPPPPLPPLPLEQQRHFQAMSAMRQQALQNSRKNSNLSIPPPPADNNNNNNNSNNNRIRGLSMLSSHSKSAAWKDEAFKLLIRNVFGRFSSQSRISRDDQNDHNNHNDEDEEKQTNLRPWHSPTTPGTRIEHDIDINEIMVNGIDDDDDDIKYEFDNQTAVGESESPDVATSRYGMSSDIDASSDMSPPSFRPRFGMFNNSNKSDNTVNSTNSKIHKVNTDVNGISRDRRNKRNRTRIMSGKDLDKIEGSEDDNISVFSGFMKSITNYIWNNNDDKKDNNNDNAGSPSEQYYGDRSGNHNNNNNNTKKLGAFGRMSKQWLNKQESVNSGSIESDDPEAVMARHIHESNMRADERDLDANKSQSGESDILKESYNIDFNKKSKRKYKNGKSARFEAVKHFFHTSMNFDKNSNASPRTTASSNNESNQSAAELMNSIHIVSDIANNNNNNGRNASNSHSNSNKASPQTEIEIDYGMGDRFSYKKDEDQYQSKTSLNESSKFNDISRNKTPSQNSINLILNEIIENDRVENREREISKISTTCDELLRDIDALRGLDMDLDNQVKNGDNNNNNNQIGEQEISEGPRSVRNRITTLDRIERGTTLNDDDINDILRILKDAGSDSVSRDASAMKSPTDKNQVRFSNDNNNGNNVDIHDIIDINDMSNVVDINDLKLENKNVSNSNDDDNDGNNNNKDDENEASRWGEISKEIAPDGSEIDPAESEVPGRRDSIATALTAFTYASRRNLGMDLMNASSNQSSSMQNSKDKNNDGKHRDRKYVISVTELKCTGYGRYSFSASTNNQVGSPKDENNNDKKIESNENTVIDRTGTDESDIKSNINDQNDTETSTTTVSGVTGVSGTGPMEKITEAENESETKSHKSSIVSDDEFKDDIKNDTIESKDNGNGNSNNNKGKDSTPENGTDSDDLNDLFEVPNNRERANADEIGGGGGRVRSNAHQRGLTKGTMSLVAELDAKNEKEAKEEENIRKENEKRVMFAKNDSGLIINESFKDNISMISDSEFDNNDYQNISNLSVNKKKDNKDNKNKNKLGNNDNNGNNNNDDDITRSQMIKLMDVMLIKDEVDNATVAAESRKQSLFSDFINDMDEIENFGKKSKVQSGASIVTVKQKHKYTMGKKPKKKTNHYGKNLSMMSAISGVSAVSGMDSVSDVSEIDDWDIKSVATAITEETDGIQEL